MNRNKIINKQVRGAEKEGEGLGLTKCDNNQEIQEPWGSIGPRPTDYLRAAASTAAPTWVEPSNMQPEDQLGILTASTDFILLYITAIIANIYWIWTMYWAPNTELDSVPIKQVPWATKTPSNNDFQLNILRQICVWPQRLRALLPITKECQSSSFLIICFTATVLSESSSWCLAHLLHS